MQPLLIALGTATRRWAMRPQLAKGKIVAEHSQSRAAECICQRQQQRRSGVCSRTVGQDQTVANRLNRAVQESVNWCCIR